MNRSLSPEDRRLVDEAIAAGRVSRVAPPAVPSRARKPSAEVAVRRRQVAEAVERGSTVPEIAEAHGVPVHTIRADVYKLGLAPRRARRKNAGDPAAERKRGVAREKAAVVQDRRRFKTVPVPMGEPSVMAPETAAGTLFPSRVFDPTDAEPVLKDGSSNSKIGGDVLVGWLKGARIVTLTLEERATCPRSCELWRGCYGNAMQHARRWRHGPELMDRITGEIDALCRAHEKVLVRLHVLGDFWSAEYVEFWRNLLDLKPNLYVFGFTAHRAKSTLGAAIARIRSEMPGRFFIRHSGQTGPWGSFTVDFPTAAPRIGDAPVCPEQRDGMLGSRRGIHCGNCGLCWKGDAPIAFVVH